MDGEKGTLGRGMHGFFMDLRFSFEMDGEKSPGCEEMVHQRYQSCWGSEYSVLVA